MIFLLLEGVTDGVIGGYFTIFYGTLELLKRVQKNPEKPLFSGVLGWRSIGDSNPGHPD